MMERISSLLSVALIVLLSGVVSASSAQAEAVPSFDCSKSKAGSIEALICDTEELSQLDFVLSKVYGEALTVDSELVTPSTLKAEQRGWIKGRDECWKESDRKECVRNLYQRRIAELQTKYRLLSPVKTISYSCENNPANEVVVNRFATEPATVIAERGDKSYLLFRESKKSGESGSEQRFAGRNETLIFDKNSLKATFAYEGPQLNCVAPKEKVASLHPSWDVDGDGLNDCEKDGSCDHTVDYSKPRSS